MNEPIVRVKLEQVLRVPTIHVYGLPHGIDETGALHSGVRRILQEEAKTFGPTDYRMVEGFETDHVIELLPPEEREGARREMVDSIGATVQKALGNEWQAAERPEYYFHQGEAIFDPQRKLSALVHGEYGREAARPQAHEYVSSRSAHELMRPGLRYVQKAKQQTIDDLKSTGIRLMDLRRFVEFRTTFRSLLMARAAQYRAEALGHDVRLFTGFLHPDEIGKFLEDPSEVDRYVKRLQDQGQKTLLSLYQQHEKVNRQISQAFDLARNIVPKEKHEKFLRFLAFRIQRAMVHAQIGQDIERFTPQQLAAEFKRKS